MDFAFASFLKRELLPLDHLKELVLASFLGSTPLSVLYHITIKDIVKDIPVDNN